LRDRNGRASSHRGRLEAGGGVRLQRPFTQLRYVESRPSAEPRRRPGVAFPAWERFGDLQWCLENDFLMPVPVYFGYNEGQGGDGYLGNGPTRYGIAAEPVSSGGSCSSSPSPKRLPRPMPFTPMPLMYFYNRCLRSIGGFAAPHGYSSVATSSEGIIRKDRTAARVQDPDLTWKEIRRPGLRRGGERRGP